MLDYVDYFKGISDKTRLRIIALISRMNRELCVCQITEALGESQYKISRHLKILKNSGWLKERKDSRWVYFSLAENPDPFVRQMLQTLTLLPEEYLELAVPLTEINKISRKNNCKD
ncbi:MAG: ArsR/SmtB family transcription factor [Candidatus Omnitrophota bacterium]